MRNMTEHMTIDRVALTTVAGGATRKDAAQLARWQAQKGFDAQQLATYCYKRYGDRFNSWDDAVGTGAPKDEAMCGVAHQLGRWKRGGVVGAE